MIKKDIDNIIISYETNQILRFLHFIHLVSINNNLSIIKSH